MKLKQTKMVQEQWLQLKMFLFFFISLNWLLVRGNKDLVGRVEQANFLLKGGLPHAPVGKTLHKLCQQVFI